MPTGRCKLCLREEQDLQESHLMPAGMYRRIRSEEKNPHPIMITADGSRPNSMQVTDYVLCRECESRFDALGENYTLRFAAGNGRFRLLEELETAQPSFAKPEWRGYKAADSPGIKREQLAYFAFSIFWRASAHIWPSTDGKSKLRGIDLGKDNNEHLRRYLYGKSAGPPGMMLFFVVLTDRLSQGTFYLPSLSHKKDFCWSYGFSACGLTFLLTVGRRLTRGNVATSLDKSAEQWIWVRDGEAKTIEALSAVIPKQPPQVRLK
jgi:hypothetical protein